MAQKLLLSLPPHPRNVRKLLDHKADADLRHIPCKIAKFTDCLLYQSALR